VWEGGGQGTRGIRSEQTRLPVGARETPARIRQGIPRVGADFFGDLRDVRAHRCEVLDHRHLTEDLRERAFSKLLHYFKDFVLSGLSEDPTRSQGVAGQKRVRWP